MRGAIEIILLSSILIQLSAASYALFLIRVTGFKYSWVFISVALYLMSFRRIIPLCRFLANRTYEPDMMNETIGLVLSVFMLIGIIGIRSIFMERKKSEEEIKALLHDKETLICELYHRTRNTLQIIRGLIILQATEFSTNPDVQHMALDVENRLQAIILVHHNLYKSKDLSHISIKEYLEELTTYLIQNDPDPHWNISLNTEIADISFLIDIAIPIGLIVNELLTNSINYAFPDNRTGTITVALRMTDPNTAELDFSDDGIGMPDGFDLKEPKTLGLYMIMNIVEQQLNGTVKVWNGKGLSFRFLFPTNKYTVRV